MPSGVSSLSKAFFTSVMALPSFPIAFFGFGVPPAGGVSGLIVASIGIGLGAAAPADVVLQVVLTGGAGPLHRELMGEEVPVFLHNRPQGSLEDITHRSIGQEIA